MKIAVCSDLHLEFGPIELKNPGGVDLLILSGDILVERDLDVYDRRQIEMGTMMRKSMAYHAFMENVCSEFKNVIYVAGNHEHYHGDFALTLKELKRKLAHYKNLHVLDKEIVKIDDITFVGGTLWTDMNKEDPMTLHAISSMMNDFRCVKNSSRSVYRSVPIYEYDENGAVKLDDKGYQIQIGMKKKEEPSRFSPEDAVEDHKKFLQYLKIVMEGCAAEDKIVVIGHHAPSKVSTHPRYAHETLMNGGYSSDLSEFILDHPQIKLWTHGHTHDVYDYMIGTTRIVCNPRGYINYEQRADEFELKVVEL